MRRRTTRNIQKTEFRCRDCARSYDWRDRGFDGSLILCRCPFYTGGKWCKFLTDPQCEHFTRRKDNGQD